MKSISDEVAARVAGGMIGGGYDSFGIPLLSIGQNGSSQVFDDGSRLFFNENGGLLGAMGTDGNFYVAPGMEPIPGTPCAFISRLGLGLACDLTINAFNGLGAYNSAAGSGQQGSQPLPPIPAVAP